MLARLEAHVLVLLLGCVPVEEAADHAVQLALQLAHRQVDRGVGRQAGGRVSGRGVNPMQVPGRPTVMFKLRHQQHTLLCGHAHTDAGNCNHTDSTLLHVCHSMPTSGSSSCVHRTTSS